MATPSRLCPAVARLRAFGKNGVFWDLNKHEFAVYVTNLPEEYTYWQIQIMYREGADEENVFDELKNQWDFGGFRAFGIKL